MIHLYVAVNAANASDNNLGTTPTSPLRTLAGVFRRLPKDRVLELTVVHFGSGTYQWSRMLGPFELADNVIFVGDGAEQEDDNGFTQIADGVCLVSSVNAVAVGGIDVDIFQNKTIVIDATGDRRTVRNNTSTSIVPDYNFTTVPTGSYRIVEPAVIFERDRYPITDLPFKPAIYGVGGLGWRAAQSHNGPPAPSLYLANIRLTSTTGSLAVVPWDIVDSSVVLCGVELLEQTTQFMTFTADSRSFVRAGYDEVVLGVHLDAPFAAGLAASATQWVGWGLSQPRASREIAHEILYLSGFVNLINAGALGGEWWIFGGCFVELGASRTSFIATGGARVTLGEYVPSRKGNPVLVRHSGAGVSVAALEASGGASINLLHCTVEKTNTGLGVAAIGADGHGGTQPGFISIAGDTGLVVITGITGTTSPSYGIVVRGGGRVNWMNGYLVMSGWDPGQETALCSRRLDQSPPDDIFDLDDYTFDGATFFSDDGSAIERF